MKATLKKTDGSTVNVTPLDISQVQKIVDVGENEEWSLSITDSTGVTETYNWIGRKPKK